MNLNKGGASIIIISVVVALLFFVIAGSIGGYFIWKNYFAEEEEEEEEKDKDKNGGSSVIPDNIIRDAQGFVDCGRSNHNEESFDDPFLSINFNDDKAFSCMGKNYKSSCSKAKLSIDIDGIDLTYKFLTSGSDCYARLEADNASTGALEWIQCPISNLTYFVNDQAKSIPIFNDIKEKLNSGNGEFGATIFTVLAIVLSGEVGSAGDFGCQASF